MLQELKRGREVCKESPTIEEGWRDKNIIHIENRTLVWMNKKEYNMDYRMKRINNDMDKSIIFKDM